MLHEILYSSAATSSMTSAQLSALAIQSSESNHEGGISGCLVYHKREFMQLLEGEQDEIENLLAKIIKDSRNTNLKVIWQGPIEQRAFASWGMAFVNLEEGTKPSGIQEMIEQGLNSAQITGHHSTARELFEIIRKEML